MTASEVRCASCGKTYMVPTASLISDAFERERLLDWVARHEPCASAALSLELDAS